MLSKILHRRNIEWKKVLKCPNYVAKILIYPKKKLKNCLKCSKILGKFVLKSYINLGAKGVGGLMKHNITTEMYF